MTKLFATTRYTLDNISRRPLAAPERAVQTRPLYVAAHARVTIVTIMVAHCITQERPTHSALEIRSGIISLPRMKYISRHRESPTGTCAHTLINWSGRPFYGRVTGKKQKRNKKLPEKRMCF